MTDRQQTSSGLGIRIRMPWERERERERGGGGGEKLTLMDRPETPKRLAICISVGEREREV